MNLLCRALSEGLDEQRAVFTAFAEPCGGVCLLADGRGSHVWQSLGWHTSVTVTRHLLSGRGEDLYGLWLLLVLEAADNHKEKLLLRCSQLCGCIFYPEP